MTDATVNVPVPPKRKGKLLKILAWTAVSGVVLLVAAYFVVTSAAFLKSVVLPRAGAALGAELTVSDATLHPFSQLILRDLKVQPKGHETLITAQEVRVNYHLMDIIGGNIHIDEVALVAPTMTLVQGADGANNLDPVLKALNSKPAATPAKSSKPPQLDIGKVTMSNATLSWLKNYAGGQKDSAMVSNLNLTVTGVKNGQTAQIQIDAGALADLNPPKPGTNGLLAASLKGNFTCALGQDLQPGAIKGSLNLDVPRASGAFAELAAAGATLDCEITPAEIKQLALHFQKNGAPLGELTVSGPLDTQKLEGRLTVALRGIDRRLLDLAAAATGIDFGTTTLNCTNVIQLTKGGTVITATGRLEAAKVQLTRAGQTMPTLEFNTDYDVTVDRTGQSALLRGLDLSGTQGGKPLLRVSLSKPMSVGWGGASNAVGEATLDLAVTNLNLADWKAFLNNAASAGLVNVDLKLVAQQGGQALSYDLNTEVKDLVASVSTNQSVQATVSVQVKGQATDFKLFTVSDSQVRVTRQNETLASVSAAGSYNVAQTSLDLQVALQASLAGLLQVFPQPNVSLSSGAVEFKGRVTQKQNIRSVAGNLSLTNLTGAVAANQLRDFGATLALDVTNTPEQIQIAKGNLQLLQGKSAAGSLDLSGTYGLTNSSIDLQVTVRATLATLVKAFPQAGLSVTSGTLDFKGHVGQQDKTQMFDGQVTLARLTGQFGDTKVQELGTVIDLDGTRTPAGIRLSKVFGQVTQGGKPGGTFDVSGNYSLVDQSASATVKLAGLNERALEPVLGPLLADKKLISVAINAQLDAQYTPKPGSPAEGMLQGTLQVTNLVVQDPKQQLPATPLEASLAVDGSLHQKSAVLREFQIGLTPTARGTNEINITGQLDLSDTNAVQGNLKMAAASLDLTAYYDLFAGGSNTNVKPASAPAPKPAATAATSNDEPPPVKLPLRNFTLTTDLKRVYLHEVEITNFQTTVKVDGGHIVAKPFQLTFNGAPLTASADVDLGQPGYKYDVTLDARSLPYAPLVDTFAPALKGKLGGAITAQGHVTGAGITGAGLQKNLNGQFYVATTNLNLSVIDVKNPLIKGVINVIAVLPELVSNPTAAITSILGLGQNGGSLMTQLQQSPLQIITVRAIAGSGKINLDQTLVQSAAFQATAQGTITLNQVFTNSTLNIPVTIALSQSIATKLNLRGADTANATYVPMPQFLTMTGTLGNSKTDINHLALAGTVMKGVGSGVLNQVTDPNKPLGGLLNQLFKGKP